MRLPVILFCENNIYFSLSFSLTEQLMAAVEEPSLPVADLDLARGCGKVQMVAQAGGKAVAQHRQHPLELLLLRLRGEAAPVPG